MSSIQLSEKVNMINNKIKILFYSENLNLIEAMVSLISDEADFRYSSVNSIQEVNKVLEVGFDGVLILDTDADLDSLNSITNFKTYHLINQPIIFLTKNDINKKDLKNEGMNCVDVIVKPFRIEELFLKCRLILSSCRRSTELNIPLSDYYFEPKKKTIKSPTGILIKLTEKETKLIECLYKSGGKVVTKGVLLTAVWGYNETISTHTLETHIYRLRQKIEKGCQERSFILTNSQGYYLNIF
jgi:DNA-binding response OmpR family regulator